MVWQFNSHDATAAQGVGDACQEWQLKHSGLPKYLAKCYVASSPSNLCQVLEDSWAMTTLCSLLLHRDKLQPKRCLSRGDPSTASWVPTLRLLQSKENRDVLRPPGPSVAYRTLPLAAAKGTIVRQKPKEEPPSSACENLCVELQPGF